MTIKKVILFFVIVLIGIVLAYYGPNIWKESADTRGKYGKEMPEKTKSLVRSALVTKGVVESPNQAEVSSKVIGRIQKMLVNENEYVTEKQTLVQLDDEEIKAQLSEAEALIMKADADYKKSVTDYERYERLFRNKAVTLNELEEFNRRVRSNKGELNRVKAKIDVLRSVIKDYVLKSPIKGIVIKKYYEAGEVVNSGAPVLLLADTDSLRVRTELDETDVGKVKVGQTAKITTEAYPGRLYKGVVEKISQDVKREKIKTFDPLAWIDINSQEVTILLNSSVGLKIGMTVEVRFD